jgi:virginiamycin B lyase
MSLSPEGKVYFTEFGSNKLAMIDAETMAIHEFVLPNRRSRPRRLAITSDWAIWYTDYPRGQLGRFDPRTGAGKQWPSPSGADSAPYGITTAKDVIWYSESGVSPNTLVRFDPRTEAFQTWPIPSGGGIVRNMMATRESNLVLACSGVNRIALVKIG